MNQTPRRPLGKRVGGIFAAAVLLCAWGGNAQAGEAPGETASIADSNALFPTLSSLLVDGNGPSDSNEAAGEFKLRLDQPLTLEQLGQSILGQGSSRRSTGVGLNYRLDDTVSVRGAMALEATQGGFLSLGSIQCQNGVLDAVSYRASDCTFVDDQGSSTGESVVLGAMFRAGDRATASLNLFRETSDYNQAYRPGLDALGAAGLLNPLGGNRGAGTPLIGGLNPVVSGYRSAASERTGVDVEFELGFSTDNRGDLVLGLQLTRVLDSGTEGVFYSDPAGDNWRIAESYDTARLSLDWTRGSFSGGLDSYYRSPVSFLDRAPLDSEATFDVHFTWRAPWNASVSVGASNVLGAGTEDDTVTDNTLVDPFESIYGRIPYVRYKQDL